MEIVAQEHFPAPLPGEPILIKENPATCLLRDAERALSVARDARERADAGHEASASRSAVFLYFAALEGFINFVYWYSGVEGPQWEKWSTVAKWLRAPELCLPGHGTIYGEDDNVLYRPGDPISPFGDDSDLVNRFRELRDVRNAMVHVQPVFAAVAQEAVDAHLARAEYFPLTGLPKRLVNFRVEHAETAASIFGEMVRRLDDCLKGQVGELVEAPALFEWRVEDDPSDPFDDEAG